MSQVLVLTGHGLNCQAETLRAFERAGHSGRIVHVDDLIATPEMLDAAQVLALPGGFSFGDHLGAGKALATMLAQELAEPFRAFMARGDTFALGVCNGCQALVKSGLWHPDAAVAASVGLAGNEAGTYICRWVPLTPTRAATHSPWLAGYAAGARLRLPIAHGEGRFVGEALAHAALVYDGDNPNGSSGAVAAVQGYNGRLLAMMPHPERAVRFTQLPDWTAVRERLRRSGAGGGSGGSGASGGGSSLPTHGPGQALFALSPGA